MKTPYLLAVVLLFLASNSKAQNLSPRVGQALRVLPTDSETVAVEQTTYVVPAAPRNKTGVPKADRSHSLLSNLQFGVVAPYLAGRTIELSLEARSHFRAPKGLGLMPYDGCGLLYLKPLEGGTRIDLEAALLRPAKQRVALDGQNVGVFEEKREHDLWRTYVAVPQENLVVLATDRKSLETTLSRLKKVASLEDRALPALWSGWKWVDTKAAFWAVRRFDLPGNRGLLGEWERSKQAKSFVVFSRGDSKKPSFVMRYEGNQKTAHDLFTGISRELPGQFTLIPKSSVSQYLISSGSEGYFWFYALGFLGTAIFL